MSGWRLARNRRRYFKDHHDGREKTILGKSGKFGFDDAVKIAVNNPKTARNIAARLYRFFISETDEPTEAILAPLAESFARDLDIKRLVETILRSERFFSDAVIGRRIKRPVEYAVGIIRGLEANVSAAKLAEDLAAMGENLYHPPTPNGWLGGRSWINTATMIARSNLAKSLLSDSGPYGGKCDPAALTKRHGHTDIKSAARFLASLFFAPGQTIEESLKLLPVIGGLSDRLRTFAYRLMTRPEFQLA